MEKKIHVLFVCLGNICRSPLAEGVFHQLVEQEGLSHRFSIDSAGTSANHVGELADPRTRKNAESHGITLTHRARQLTTSDFSIYDYILVMDAENAKNARSIAPEMYHEKVQLLASFHPDREVHEVPDPYWGDARDFEQVYQLCYTSGQHLLNYFKEKYI